MNRFVCAGLISIIAIAPGFVLSDDSFSLFIDQDVFYPPQNEDRNYTMGLLMQWEGDAVKQSGAGQPLELMHDKLQRWFPGLSNYKDPRVGIGAGIVVYTPENLEAKEPLSDDRPYASLLYGSIISTYINTQSVSLVRHELRAGVLGLRIAENVQTWIHQAIRASRNDGSGRVDPEGWSNQISDGGEPTLLYRIGYSRRFGEIESVDQRFHWFQSQFDSDIAVGYNNYVSAGLTIKIGYIDRYKLQPPTQIGDPNILNALPTNGSTDKNINGKPSGDRSAEIYMFGRLTGSAVAYNALIQGQFRSIPDEYKEIDIEHFVAGWQYGVTFDNGDFALTYAINGRTPEFKSSGSDRNHWWGGVYLTWRM
ncbi:MAG TPA: lipid A deacylase LpxR family protein [Kiritimatiellia bacterium]|nr:lipid A deacylase LpxR family protein [Kiritimatiellia bacterium]